MAAASKFNRATLLWASVSSICKSKWRSYNDDELDDLPLFQPSAKTGLTAHLG
jgi:hypothetical protein